MSKNESRTKNTKRNIYASYAYFIVSFLFQFVSRTIIINFLGSEYLGISSLFASILNIINAAELGFSGAIVYHMYKPIADGDVKTVCALLNLYKKIYRLIGFIVLIAGSLVTPFLNYLINGTYPDDINIYIVFLLYVLNSSVSYWFFSYKTSLLNALQRVDLCNVAYLIVVVFQYSFQIVSLVVFKNYYAFVSVMIISNVLRNMTVAFIAKKKYPEYVCDGVVEKELKKDVFTRVKGLLICNISAIAFTTLDSIILARIVGLKSVAIYSNYIIVFTGLETLIRMLRTSMQASVGDSVARESKEKNYEDMLLWQFFFSIIATFCCSCMMTIYQPFMKEWMGEDMLLEIYDVVILSLWFFLTVIQHSYFLYLTGNGMWWEIKWPYVFSTVFNIVSNIVLGIFINTTGVLLSSLLSSFIFSFLWQGTLICKIYFNKSFKQFVVREMIYLLIACLISLITYYSCYFITIDGILGLIVKICIAVLVTSVLIVVVYLKTPIFKRGVTFMKRALKAK